MVPIQFNANEFLQIIIMMIINNCDSQSALHMQEIYSPQWLISCVMMHVMHNIAFTVNICSF